MLPVYIVYFLARFYLDTCVLANASVSEKNALTQGRPCQSAALFQLRIIVNLPSLSLPLPSLSLSLPSLPSPPPSPLPAAERPPYN